MMVALFSWALAVLSLVPCQAYPDFDNQYCLTPWNSVHFSYSAAAGPENEVYPETCWNRCLAQKPDLQVIAFTKTRTDELICFCPNTPAAEYTPDEIDDTFCESCTSPNGGTFICGSKRGLLGVLSRALPSPILSGLAITLLDDTGSQVPNEIATDTLVNLEVTFNDGPLVTCNSVNGCPHPVELKVNFGDGSGDLIYNYELGETINVWTHMYTYPGEFMTVVIG
ncbi:uncharacterized protein LOC131878996 [Tigriopus californicus]|uniref:uncharacterized protein LOC131878996 n=1 Tax=Tigriopus californicus TaxID=6832 RepID=UPI0027DA0ED7|nr:uncharacterized protein LOC131878996 [Tigriopus californicus]